MALQRGARYVAQGFSGDKAQLVPLIEGAIRHVDFIDLAAEVKAEPAPGEVITLPQADGSLMLLRKTARRLRPDRPRRGDEPGSGAAVARRGRHRAALRRPRSDRPARALRTSAVPLNKLAEAALCPGAAALAKINASFR